MSIHLSYHVSNSCTALTHLTKATVSMAESLPSASEGGVTAAESPEDPRLPTNAEDRKAAAALSSLNANEISADSSHDAAAPKTMSAADQEALGKAMSRLEIASGTAAKKEGNTSAGESLAGKKKEREEARKKAEEEKEKRRKVKVKAEDVAVLVSSCCVRLCGRRERLCRIANVVLM